MTTQKQIRTQPMLLHNNFKNQIHNFLVDKTPFNYGLT